MESPHKTRRCLGASCRYLRAVTPGLLLLPPPGPAGALTLAVPAAALLLSLGQSLQPVQELHLPGQEVRLDAAVTALHHVAVALAPGHDSPAAQHPQPLVHVCTHLDEKQQVGFSAAAQQSTELQPQTVSEHLTADGGNLLVPCCSGRRRRSSRGRTRRIGGPSGTSSRI